MNYEIIQKVTEVLEELAATLRNVLDKYHRNEAEWEALQARLEAELKQIQDGK